MSKTSKLIVGTNVAVVAIVTAAAAAVAAPPQGEGPTCSPTWANHGDHITGDYVGPNGSAGGGAPAHFTMEVGPGASFCLPQASAPSIDGPPNR